MFDVSRVTISGLDQVSPAPMGVPITFSVDAAGAGEGTLELVVSTANNTVKAEVSEFSTIYCSIEEFCEDYLRHIALKIFRIWLVALLADALIILSFLHFVDKFVNVVDSFSWKDHF